MKPSPSRDGSSLQPAKVIVVHPSGETETFTHDPADPLWWQDDRGLFNGWKRLADRIERFMEAQTRV